MGSLEEISYIKRATKNAQVIGNANKTAPITPQTGKKKPKKKKKLCLVTKERPSTPVLPQKNGAINSIPNIFFIGKEKKKKKKIP